MLKGKEDNEENELFILSENNELFISRCYERSLGEIYNLRISFLFMFNYYISYW